MDKNRSIEANLICIGILWVLRHKLANALHKEMPGEIPDKSGTEVRFVEVYIPPSCAFSL